MTTDPTTTTVSSRAARSQLAGGRRSAGAAGPRAKARAASADSGASPKNPLNREFVSNHKLGLGVLLIVAFTVVALYGPLRAYYVAWRTNEIQTASLETVNANNDQLKGQIQSLMTPEGIKDEARKRGYVDQGESSVVVTGFADEGDASVTAAAEDPWYIAVLDSIFGFEGV